MANELEVIRESNLGTMFEPATLEVQRFEEMKEVVQGFSDRYTNLVFTADEKKGAEEVRSKLIEIRDKFEKERKIIKKAYNEPLNEYEAKIKKLNSMIDVPLNQIREGLKEIDNAEKELRAESLKEVLANKLDGLEVGVDQPKNWLNKTMWTEKMNPTAKLNKEIDAAIETAVKEKKQREAEMKILEEFCKAKDIDPSGWVSQLDYKTATEVIDLINLDIERKARIAEEQEKKKAEHEAFEEKQAKALAEAEQNKIVEKPIEQPTVQPDPQSFDTFEPAVIINVIRVKGTQTQLNALNGFLIDSGIEVGLVADETDYEPIVNYSMDDLPF